MQKLLSKSWFGEFSVAVFRPLRLKVGSPVTLKICERTAHLLPISGIGDPSMKFNPFSVHRIKIFHRSNHNSLFAKTFITTLRSDKYFEGGEKQPNDRFLYLHAFSHYFGNYVDDSKLFKVYRAGILGSRMHWTGTQSI